MPEYIAKSVAIARLTILEIGNPRATIEDARRTIADTRTADVDTVVRGRWIYDKKAQRPYCSVCKEYFYGATNSSMSYCSNCGAKMDGGADHETD